MRQTIRISNLISKSPDKLRDKIRRKCFVWNEKLTKNRCRAKMDRDRIVWHFFPNFYIRSIFILYIIFFFSNWLKPFSYVMIIWSIWLMKMRRKKAIVLIPEPMTQVVMTKTRLKIIENDRRDLKKSLNALKVRRTYFFWNKICFVSFFLIILFIIYFKWRGLKARGRWRYCEWICLSSPSKKKTPIIKLFVFASGRCM